MSQSPPPLRIVRVVFDGVKAFDRDLRLAQLNLLIGDPGTGKSSVADALRFAALGRIPSLGGRELDTARILRGSRMVVRVELSDGRWFHRSLGREGASLRAEARASWLPTGATTTAHAGAIRSLFGTTDGEAGEHLDLRELLDATPSERASKLDALLAATAAQPTEIADHVEALTVARIAKIHEDRIPVEVDRRRAMIAGLIATLDAAQAALLPRVREEILAQLAGKGLPAALELANGEKRTAAESVRRRSAAAAELEDRDREATAPAATLADLDTRKQSASDRLAVVRADREREGGAQAARAAAATAVAAAARPTADHEAVLTAIAEARADADRWSDQAALLVEPAEVPPAVLVGSDPMAEEQAADLDGLAAASDAKAATIESAVPPRAPERVAVPSTDGAAEVLRQRREAVEVAKADPWVRVAVLADEIDLGSKKAIAWTSELRRLAARYGLDVPQAEAAADAALVALRAAAAAAVEAELVNASYARAHVEATRAWEIDRDEASMLRRRAAEYRGTATRTRDEERMRLATANGAARAVYLAAGIGRAAQVHGVRERKADLLRRAAEATTNADGDERAIAAEASALREAQARLDGIGEVAPYDVGSADVEISELSRSLAAIEVDRRAVAGADARKRELGDLARAIAEAQAATIVWTAAEWSVLRVRELDLSARGEPILARMRAFLGGAGRAEIPYIRVTKAATDFGWRRAGVEISIEALSGGETVLYTAALASAVIDLRRPEIRCLIVEAAELGDATAAAQVLAGIGAVAGQVDLAIVATCAEVRGPHGWLVLSFAGSGPVVETDRS